MIVLSVLVLNFAGLGEAYDPTKPISESNRPYLFGMPQPRHTLPGRSQKFNSSRPVFPKSPLPYTFPTRLSEATLVRLDPKLRKAYVENRINKFVNWGIAQGVYINPLVAFNVTEHGVMIQARHTIPRDEEILRVPLHLLISQRTAQETGPFGWFQQWEGPDEAVVMFLMHELSNHTSRFRPWFDVWPPFEDGYHTYSPITWTPKELEMQLPDFVPAIMPIQQRIREAYTRLKKTLVDRLPETILDVTLPNECGDFDPWRFIEFYTFERFQYAWMMDATRRHACPSIIDAPSCLIPFMDMFNHEPGVAGVRTPQVAEDVPGIATIRTFRRYQKGEELKVAYSVGASNAYLLSYYGFVVPDQPFDLVYINLTQFVAPEYNLLSEFVLGNYTRAKALLTRQAPPFLALHAMRLNVSASHDAPRPWGGRSQAGRLHGIYGVADADSFLDTPRLLALETEGKFTNYEALRRLRAFQPVDVDLELKAILKLLGVLNPLVTKSKEALDTVYPYFAYQTAIATERAFRKTLDQALHDPRSPKRDPREKFRYASMLREEQSKIHLNTVTYLMKRRKYILEYCKLPPFDWEEDHVMELKLAPTEVD